MKKLILLSAAMAFGLAFTTAAFATEHPGNSEPGLDRFLEISANANDDAQCGTGAGSGAFGFLGKDLNPSNPALFGGNLNGGPGVDGHTRTGPNNSDVCGEVPD